MAWPQNNLMLTGAALMTVVLAPPAEAGLITDKSSFGSIPHTVIDFESLGDGTPITVDILPLNTNFDLAQDEYATKGVVFTSEHGMGLARDSSFSWQQALSNGGSPTVNAAARAVRVGEALEQHFEVMFSVEVRSVGFFALLDANFERPFFEALDSGGNILGTFGLDEQTTDGQQGFVVYGFIGFASATPIASVRLASGVFAFDDLMFSSQIPTPSGAVVLGAGLIAIGRRRR